MKYIYVLLLIFLTFSIHAQNLDSQNFEVINDIENLKKEIFSYYSSPECFFLVFRTDVVFNSYGKQSVNGTMRADNVKNRLRIILTEPNLGIIYSWMTVLNNDVYMTSPRFQGIIKKNISEIELGSLANNQIKLPFSLFRDILFGRIPEQIQTAGIWEQKEELSVRHLEKGNQIEIFFDRKEKKRIHRILFEKQEFQYRAIVHFIGKFYDTKYPQKIKIQTYQNQKPLEVMDILFERYIDNARCNDEFFPIR